MIFKIAIFLALGLLGGCLPVPTIPHEVGVILDKDTFESFQPGEATRADVLMNFGEPKYRYENDQYLIYEWGVAYGYVIVGGGYTAYPLPVGANRYLCFEFGTDSYIVRREHFEGTIAPFADSDEAIQVCAKGQEKDKELTSVFVPTGSLPPLRDETLAGEVTVIRISSFFAVLVDFIVKIDGEEIFPIRSGQHTKFRLNEGDHRIGIECSSGQSPTGEEMKITVNQKKPVFLLISPAFHCAGIKQISENEAQMEIQKTEYVRMEQ